MDEGSETPQPKAQPEVGSDEASDSQVASARPSLSPLSSSPLRRHNLRQEPGAVVPHAGICAGGAGKLAFLPRRRLLPLIRLEIT